MQKSMRRSSIMWCVGKLIPWDCFEERIDQKSSGGTSGYVVASRLAEDPALSILVIEAGEHNEEVDATIMPSKSESIRLKTELKLN